MMALLRSTMVVALLVCVAGATAQQARREPHIGYLYPAGGQQDSVTMIAVGGQYLANASEVYISGEGVHAKVIQYIRPPRNIQKEQRELLQKRLREVRNKRLVELTGKRINPPQFTQNTSAPKTAQKPKTSTKNNTPTPAVKLPGHPLLIDSAMEAVRKYKVSPTLLKGTSTQVMATVTVNFVPDSNTDTLPRGKEVLPESSVILMR